MTNHINEWIVARVRHCQPVSTKPQDVDVFEAEIEFCPVLCIKMQQQLKASVHVTCLSVGIVLPQCNNLVMATKQG